MPLHASWLKPSVWGVVGGAVATMIVGFSWMGWVLGSTAERMAVERSRSAMIVALTPACVASFMQQPDAATKLAELRQIESWKQRQFIADGGWATPRGDKTPHSGVANACAEKLLSAKTQAAAKDATRPADEERRSTMAHGVVPLRRAIVKGGLRAHHETVSDVQDRAGGWSRELLQRSVLPESGPHHARAWTHCRPSTPTAGRPEALAASAIQVRSHARGRRGRRTS